MGVLDKYSDLRLKDIAEQLHIDYYKVLSAIASKAGALMAELKTADINHILAHYTAHCEKVLQLVSICIADRQEHMMPYLDELQEKDATGHNCANCSGNCDMGHKAQLIALQDSHRQLCNMLQEMNHAALPLYSTSHNYPLLYKLLRCEMQLLDTVVRELMFVEEASLLPGIIQSQKRINVYS
jgi:hypothetical protein